MNMVLALGIDGSSRANEAESGLQMEATPYTLRNPEVGSAMEAMSGVAIAAAIWADSAWGARIFEWQTVQVAA